MMRIAVLEDGTIIANTYNSDALILYTSFCVFDIIPFDIKPTKPPSVKLQVHACMHVCTVSGEWVNREA